MAQNITLESIASEVAASRTPVIEIHSVDPAIYLVFLVDSGEATRSLAAGSAQSALVPVVGRKGQPLRFPSRYAACLALKKTGLAAAQFVHRSAYDEMIGLASSPSHGEMREFIDLARIAEA